MKYSGVILDPRSQKEKAKDWDSREIVLGAGTGSKITEITIPYYDQMATSSCVPHAVLHMFAYNGILKKEVSRFPLYRKRFNYPFEGANATDIIQKSHSKHHKDGGLKLYKDVKHPSSLTESWANSLKYEIGEDLTEDFDYFTIHDWNDLEIKVNSGIAVTLAFHSTMAEWSREYVTETDATTPSTSKVRHQITLIPKGAFIENKKLWFSAIDSSKAGGRKLRYFQFEFLKKRVIVQPQFALPKSVVPIELPKVSKTLSACKLGDTSQAVTNLQGFLVDKGFLDKKYITSFYGVLTSKAVLWFQLKNHEKFKETIPELLEYKGDSFGPQSVKIAKNTI